MGRERTGGKKRKVQMVKESIRFHSLIYSKDIFEQCASHRVRHCGYYSRQNRPSSHFHETYLLLGKVDSQKIASSRSKSQIVLNAMKETNEGLRKRLSKLEREKSFRFYDQEGKSSLKN